MARTNPSDVAKIFNTDLDTSDNGALDMWVEMAHEHVNDIAEVDNSIPESRLEQLERLIAAHLASAQDQRIGNASRETGSVNYKGQTGRGWDGTLYGQRAISLDPTGTLEQSEKPAAGVFVPDSKGME